LPEVWAKTSFVNLLQAQLKAGVMVTSEKVDGLLKQVNTEVKSLELTLK
jgi:hypothetical protein